MTTAAKTPRITDIGPPHYEKFLPPLVKKNYGQWKYHEMLAPGVLCHVAESGDRLYTVRAATPRLMAVQTLRKFADLADKYCGGHLRFTSRNNIEFLLEDKNSIEPPANGTLTLRSDGSFTYTPFTGFNGSDSFTYQDLVAPPRRSGPCALVLRWGT